jgi:rare lipoprotein A
MLRPFLRAGLFKGCFLTGVCLSVAACTIVEIPYHITKGAVKTAAYVVKGSYELTAGTTKVVYRIGKFTFKAVKAPLEWPLTSSIETIDGLPSKEAIKQGRVKTAPYTVKGKTYYPMSIEEAQTYRATGTASWYGYETSRSKYGHMTANGEVFDPEGLTAAHKYLPLPTHVKVTNLENGRSIILGVNDRGPFPSSHNPSSGERNLDVSARAARLLGFYHKGLAKVQIEVIQLQQG